MGQARKCRVSYRDASGVMHVVEVRTPKGRFVDRREWKTGDTATITAEIRSAFPIVAATTAAGVTEEQLRGNLERALARSRGITQLGA